MRQARVIDPNGPSQERVIEAADVNAATSGDAEAFEHLYRSHVSRVYGLACRLAGDLGGAPGELGPLDAGPHHGQEAEHVEERVPSALEGEGPRLSASLLGVATAGAVEPGPGRLEAGVRALGTEHVIERLPGREGDQRPGQGGSNGDLPPEAGQLAPPGVDLPGEGRRVVPEGGRRPGVSEGGQEQNPVAGQGAGPDPLADQEPLGLGVPQDRGPFGPAQAQVGHW